MFIIWIYDINMLKYVKASLNIFDYVICFRELIGAPRVAFCSPRFRGKAQVGGESEASDGIYRA